MNVICKDLEKLLKNQFNIELEKLLAKVVSANHGIKQISEANESKAETITGNIEMLRFITTDREAKGFDSSTFERYVREISRCSGEINVKGIVEYGSYFSNLNAFKTSNIVEKISTFGESEEADLLSNIVSNAMHVDYLMKEYTNKNKDADKKTVRIKDVCSGISVSILHCENKDDLKALDVYSLGVANDLVRGATSGVGEITRLNDKIICSIQDYQRESGLEHGEVETEDVLIDSQQQDESIAVEL